jgi:hypothetical protein
MSNPTGSPFCDVKNENTREWLVKYMLKTLVWLFFAITSYLILADAVQPWRAFQG